ncbi:MAG: protein-disulfide reductase DsbD domain-containing protein [Pyrinomonadaceae bacterium]
MKSSWIWLGAWCAVLVCALGCSKPAANQGSNAASPAERNIRTSADVVKLGGSAIAFSQAGSGEVAVPVIIDEGFHLNANPATFPYLIPTEVTPEKVAGIEVGKPIYPTPEKRKFQFAPEPLAVYEGKIEVRLPLRTSGFKGSRELPITVRVQACDQEKCFPPDTLRRTITVKVNE